MNDKDKNGIMQQLMLLSLMSSLPGLGIGGPGMLRLMQSQKDSLPKTTFFNKEVPIMGPHFSQLQKDLEELEKLKLEKLTGLKLTGKIDPVTGSKYNELDFIPERSDWAKENIDSLKQDPITGEWYKPTGPASGEELIERFLEELEALKTMSGLKSYDKK